MAKINKFGAYREFADFCKEQGYKSLQETITAIERGEIPVEIIEKVVLDAKEELVYFYPAIFGGYSMDGKLSERAQEMVDSGLELYRTKVNIHEDVQEYLKRYLKNKNPFVVFSAKKFVDGNGDPEKVSMSIIRTDLDLREDLKYLKEKEEEITSEIQDLE